MSEHSSAVKWYGRTVFLGEKYLLCFHPRDLSREEQRKKESLRKMEESIPAKIFWKMMINDRNPRDSLQVQELTGRQIINLAKMGNLFPVFDSNFEWSRKLMLMSVSGIKFFKESALEKLKRRYEET